MPAPRRLLPGLARMGEPVIEGRLAFEEIQYIRGITLAFASYERERITVAEGAVGPYIPVCKFPGACGRAACEPFMLLAGMPRDKVQQHMHPPPVGFTEQPDKVIISAVPRCNQFIVAYIIAGILEGRIEAGVDPQGIASQRLYITQLLRDAGDVADPITVGIVKALGVYLIEHCILQPLRAVLVP